MANNIDITLRGNNQTEAAFRGAQRDMAQLGKGTHDAGEQFEFAGGKVSGFHAGLAGLESLISGNVGGLGRIVTRLGGFAAVMGIVGIAFTKAMEMWESKSEKAAKAAEELHQKMEKVGQKRVEHTKSFISDIEEAAVRGADTVAALTDEMDKAKAASMTPGAAKGSIRERIGNIRDEMSTRHDVSPEEFKAAREEIELLEKAHRKLAEAYHQTKEQATELGEKLEKEREIKNFTNQVKDATEEIDRLNEGINAMADPRLEKLGRAVLGKGGEQAKGALEAKKLELDMEKEIAQQRKDAHDPAKRKAMRDEVNEQRRLERQYQIALKKQGRAGLTISREDQKLIAQMDAAALAAKDAKKRAEAQDNLNQRQRESFEDIRKMEKELKRHNAILDALLRAS